MTNQHQKLLAQEPQAEELGAHMFAVRTADKPGTTTCRWAIHSKRGKVLLGTVSWYAAWRCYVFHPAPLTLFNTGCLEQIALFLQRIRNTRQEAQP